MARSGRQSCDQRQTRGSRAMNKKPTKKPGKPRRSRPPIPCDLSQVPLILTVPETAALMRRDLFNVYDLIKQNFFPEGVVHHSGRSIRVMRDPLLSFLAAGGKKLEAVQ